MMAEMRLIRKDRAKRKGSYQKINQIWEAGGRFPHIGVK